MPDDSVVKDFRPCPRLLTLWRIRTLFAAFAPALALSPWLWVRHGRWLVLTALWTTLLAAYAVFWLPTSLSRLSYGLDNGLLRRSGGLLRSSLKTLFIGSLQYVRISALPDERLLGLCRLTAFAMGGRLSFPGLTPDVARLLLESLSSGWKEDAPFD